MTEEQVFLAALDLPDQANRAAYLDEVCGQNSELRRQVEELLAAHERSGQFLDEPAAEQMAAGPQSPIVQTVALNAAGADAMADNNKTNSSPSDDDADDLQFLSPPTRPDSLGRLGHYEMLQVLGRGGFGIVFRAFDDILQRVVAVKVMAPQMAATSPARRRFLREARSSAQVRHENVVQVYEAGWVYRLPKVAEWEYACRGGPMSDKLDSAFDFYLATPTNTLLPELANSNTRLNRPSKVGSYEANRLGIYDMHGNLHEWCHDAETTADGSLNRVARGGSWDFPATACRAAFHDTTLNLMK